MTRALTTPTVQKDWIKGRTTSFVSKYVSANKAWKRKLSGGTLSAVIDPSYHKLNNKISIFREAYKLCTIRANNLSNGTPVKIVFSEKENSYNMVSKVIHISTEVLDEEIYSVPERFDVILGTVTHEMAHHLYTIRAADEFITEFHHTIFNIIEDERIEREIAANFPGYVTNLGSIKKYYFDFKYSKENWKSDKYSILFDFFFKVIRYPKYIDPTVYSTFENEIQTLHDLIVPYPQTMEECLITSKKVYELFISLFPTSTNEKPEGGKGKPAAGSSKNGEGDHLPANKENRAELNEICKKLDRINPGASKLISDAEKPHNKSARDVIAEIEALEEELTQQLFPFTIIKKVEKEVAAYNESLALIKSKAKKLSTYLSAVCSPVNNKFTAQRSGVLDESKIVDAVNGYENVYCSSFTKLGKRFSIVLLVDESGSMDSYATNESSRLKYEDARDVVVLVHEASRQVKECDLFVYGFSGVQGDLHLYPYIEDNRGDKYALGSITGRNDNPDGYAIIEVVNRVRSHTERPCLFLVISDGYPASQLYGSSYHNKGIRHTREAVEFAKKSGFLPIQIGIGVDAKNQSKMFDYFVNFQNSSQLVEQIGAIVKKNVSKLVRN